MSVYFVFGLLFTISLLEMSKNDIQQNQNNVEAYKEYVYHAMIFSKRGSTSRGLTFRHDIL